MGIFITNTLPSWAKDTDKSKKIHSEIVLAQSDGKNEKN